MMAAQGDHTETVKALIAAGADVNVVCEQVINSFCSVLRLSWSVCHAREW